MKQEENPLHLTVVCPVYNEQSAIPLFFERIKPVIHDLSSCYKVDLLFLNNASTDDTFKTLEELRPALSARAIQLLPTSCSGC